MNKNSKRLLLRNPLEIFCRTTNCFFQFCKENVKSVNKLISFIADSDEHFHVQLMANDSFGCKK